MLIRELAVITSALFIAATSSATPITMIVALSPDLEAPPVISDAKGTATLSFDPALLSDGLDYVIELDSMDSSVGLAGIYAAVPGETGPLVVELFDFTGFGIPGDPLFVSGTVMLDQATLDALLNSGAYVNVGSEDFPDGEVRGDVDSGLPIPEPGTAALLGLGLTVLATRRRTRRTLRTGV